MTKIREAPKFIEATGTFQADETTEVAAETSGKVAQTLVSEGSFVATGDVLIQLDERDAEEIRILSGVNEGERVAATNVEQLFDGVKIVGE